MANNFFLNQDPLLYRDMPYQRYGSTDELRQQLDETKNRYKFLQSQVNETCTDYVGDLDHLMRSLNDNISTTLHNDEEYKKLSAELSEIIQKELIGTIKWKINTNPIAIKNIERQQSIIEQAKLKEMEEQRKSLNELNDYVKNYSDITFDEYRRIKKGENPVKKTKGGKSNEQG